MPWDVNGNFNRLYSWVADKTNGINPSSSRFDNEDNGFASAGFGNCITRDGQGRATSALCPATDALYDLGTALLRWRNLEISGTITAPNFSGNPSFGGGGTPALPGLQVNATDYQIDLYDPSAATDQKHTFLRQEPTAFVISFLNDALAAGSNVLQFNRSGSAGTGMLGYGPVSGGAVDMTPDRASWTSTFSGPFTSNPSGSLGWERHGNHVEVFSNGAITGTATNSSNFITASGLPSSITPVTAARLATCFGLSSGGISPITGVVTVNTNGTFTIAPLGTGANSNTPVFFASGNPAGVVAGFAFRYCL